MVFSLALVLVAVLSFHPQQRARVAQWIRAFASGAKGRRFDPCRGYQEKRGQRLGVRGQEAADFNPQVPTPDLRPLTPTLPRDP